MIKVYVNNSDITGNVDLRSIKIQASTGNRRNTASFSVHDVSISEAQEIEIFKGYSLSSSISAGVSSFSLSLEENNSSLNNLSHFMRAGDIITLGYRTANVERLVVDHVTGSTVYITGTTQKTHTLGDLVGVKIFAGITLKNPREEIGRSEMMTYSVDATDYSTLLDAQNVVDTWESVNAREIISRIVYLFTAADDSSTINACETLTGVTHSGTAVTPTLDSTDKVYQNNSINMGASGAGLAKYEIRKGDLAFDNEFAGSLNDANPAGWKSGATGGISFENTGVDGGRCMKVTLSAGDYREIQSHFAGYFGLGGYTIKPNTKYIIKGYMKVSGTGTMQYGARMGILTSNSGGGSAGESFTPAVVTDNGGWTYYEQVFTSSSTAVTAHSACNFYNHGSSTFTGSVYFDKFTISEAIDISTMDHLRLWIKAPPTPSSYISGMSFRIVDNSGDSYTWAANVGAGGWGYDSGKFSDAVVSGAVDLTQIVKFEIEFTALQAISIGTFKIDHILATKDGFTTKGVEIGNVIFADVRSQYLKPTVLIEKLAKENGYFWYVDTEKDIHFFSGDDRVCPESITDITTNFNKLKISADITNLRNRQTVRGGMAPEESIYTQIKVLDGKETSYRLDYPPKDLTIYISTNGGVSWGSPRTVGIENIVDETTVDFVMNFTEKTVRNGGIALQVAGTLLKMEYYPYKDIRVQWRDQVSIDRMKTLLGGSGVYDGPVINDSSIRTFQDARNRAKAELTAYSNPVLTATFETERDGFQVGQVLTITSTKYGIDAGFVIQKVSATQKDIYGSFVYSITAGSTLYGLTEFFQYLLKNTSKGEIDVNELVDVVTNVDEVLIMGDTHSSRKLSAAGPWYVHSRTGQYAASLTLTEGGTSRDMYMDFFLVA